MKKRLFLAPLAMSVAALLGTVQKEAQATGTSISPTAVANVNSAAGMDDFVIERGGAPGLQLAQHSSHYSHMSHSSHSSHSSHRSHYSGY